MKETANRLLALSEAAPHGAHGEVAKRMGISITTSKRFRATLSGEMMNTKYPNMANEMIRHYKEILTNNVERILDLLENEEQYG